MKKFLVQSQMPINTQVSTGVDATVVQKTHQEGSIKVVMTDEDSNPTGATWTHRCSMYDEKQRSVDILKDGVRLNNATGDAYIDMPMLFFLLPGSVEIRTYTPHRKGIVALCLPRELQCDYFLYDGDQEDMREKLQRLRELVGEEVWNATLSELTGEQAATLREKLKKVLETGGRILS